MGQEKLIVLAVGMGEDTKKISKFAEKYGFTFPMVADPKLEITVRDLDPKLQKLWAESDGARVKEWSKLQEGGAIKVWRGKDARDLRKSFQDRIVKPNMAHFCSRYRQTRQTIFV